MKVVVGEAVHIVANEKSLTTDAQNVATCWNGGDYEGSGKALGDIVGILLNIPPSPPSN